MICTNLYSDFTDTFLRNIFDLNKFFFKLIKLPVSNNEIVLCNTIIDIVRYIIIKKNYWMFISNDET